MWYRVANMYKETWVVHFPLLTPWFHQILLLWLLPLRLEPSQSTLIVYYNRKTKLSWYASLPFQAYHRRRYAEKRMNCWPNAIVLSPERKQGQSTQNTKRFNTITKSFVPNSLSDGKGKKRSFTIVDQVRNAKLLHVARDAAVKKWMSALSFWENKLLTKCFLHWRVYVDVAHTKWVPSTSLLTLSSATGVSILLPKVVMEGIESVPVRKTPTCAQGIQSVQSIASLVHKDYKSRSTTLEILHSIEVNRRGSAHIYRM